MKEELKKIAVKLYERLNVIKTQGYTEARLDAAINVVDELNRKLGGDDPISSIELETGELVDDGTADGD